MFEAQYLFYSDSVYSPWFPRRGDNVLVTLDLIAISGGQLVVQLFTKNTENSGDGNDADVGGTTKIDTSTVGRTTVQWLSTLTPGLLELCRYKFSWDHASAGARAFFRMLPPLWFDSVKV
jgi:hypothetical protein